MRVCSKCLVNKPLSEYNNGYSMCKPCKRAAVVQWRANNREHYNLYMRIYKKKEALYATFLK